MVKYYKRTKGEFILSDTARIAQLNDQLRWNFSGGHIMQTAGVRALKRGMRAKVMEAVRNFKAFTPANDPRNEHNHGDFEIEGQKFIWQIDYYDLSLSQASEDPTDTTKTIRVLTVMLETEY